jgi:hypothetical protein
MTPDDELAAIEANFWRDLHDVSREVDAWPAWMKSYRIDIYSERHPEDSAVRRRTEGACDGLGAKGC